LAEPDGYELHSLNRQRAAETAHRRAALVLNLALPVVGVLLAWRVRDRYWTCHFMWSLVGMALVYLVVLIAAYRMLHPRSSRRTWIRSPMVMSELRREVITHHPGRKAHNDALIVSRARTIRGTRLYQLDTGREDGGLYDKRNGSLSTAGPRETQLRRR
jgi:hypothetical protein